MFITENTMAGLSSNYTVEAAEGYSGGIGCQIAALEAAQTDFSFLSAFVQSDAREIGMVREGAGVEEMHAMLEGAISDAWNKLKEWVKKIWEKIKGIFKAFIARLEDFMGKNGYAYFEKYKNILYDGTPIEDLKAKYSKVNDTKLKELLTGLKMGDVLADVFTGKTVDDNTDQSDLVDEYLSDMLNNNSTTDKKSFKKDFHDECFESETQEDLESGKIAEYVKYISDKKSIIEKFEKQRDAVDKGFNKISKDLDKMSSEALKDKIDNKSDVDDDGVTTRGGRYTGFSTAKKSTGANNKAIHTGFKGKGTVTQTEISKAQRRVSAVQSALSSYNSASMEAGKFAIAQSRRLAAVIVAYKMRHKNEGFSGVEMSDELYTIIGEAAEYEALSAMDDLATV